ncbi:MAG: carboxyltransferase domain-containing protein [Saprospiraceae bacterium]
MAPKIFPLSETALLVQWSEHIENALHQKVLDLNHLLSQMLFADFVETTLAYTSLAVYYQLERIESEGESRQAENNNEKSWRWQPSYFTFLCPTLPPPPNQTCNNQQTGEREQESTFILSETPKQGKQQGYWNPRRFMRRYLPNGI